MSEKPTAAFVLSLIAGVLGLVGGIAVAVTAHRQSIILEMYNMTLATTITSILVAIGVWYLIAAILILVGAFMINSGEPDKVRTGGILVLVFSILSLTNFFFLVFILGLIGGILALTWKPSRPVTAAAPPPPPPPPST